MIAVLIDTNVYVSAIAFGGTSRQVVNAIVSRKNDNHALSSAIQAQIDYLVTGDQDLLTLNPQGSLRILSPAEFLVVLDALGNRPK